MSTALNPSITPLLAYAVVALLVVLSFVGAILVVLGRVRHWVDALISERMTAIEARDIERAGAVRRSYAQTDELGVRLNTRIDQLFDIQARIQRKETP